MLSDDRDSVPSRFLALSIDNPPVSIWAVQSAQRINHHDQTFGSMGIVN